MQTITKSPKYEGRWGMGERKRDSIFASIVRYASSSLFQKFLGVFTAFLRPKLLSPELFGLWNILNILPNYASYLHLGSRSSMRFLVPYYESRGEDKRILASKAAVFHGTFYPTLFFAVILILLAIFLDTGIEDRIGLVAVGLIILLNWRLDYLIGVLKAHQEFRVISNANYLKAVALLVFNITLILLLGFYGALLATVCTITILIVFLQRHRRFSYPGRFRLGIFRDLVKTGFPIVAFNLITELIRTADRFILFFTLGAETVGYYGIAIMLLGFTLSIPAVAREVVEPRLMENLDSKAPSEIIELFLTRPLMNTCYLMPFVIAPAIILLPVVIFWILPAYEPGITPAKFLLLGGYFMASSYAIRGIIVAYGFQSKASLIALFSLVLNIVLSLTIVHLGYGPEGVAVVSGFSFLLLFVSLIYFVLRQLQTGILEFTRGLLPLFAPFPVMCTLIFLPPLLIPALQENTILTASIKMFIFLVFQGGLFEFMRRRGSVSFRIEDR